MLIMMALTENSSEVEKMLGFSKKVVLTIFSLQGGGAERFVLTLAEGFRQLGYEPHIVCFKKQVDYDNVAFPVHFLDYQSVRWLPKSLRHPLFAKKFDNYVRKHICHTPALVLSNLWQVDQTLKFSQLLNRVFVIHNTLSKEKQVHTYLSDKKLRNVYEHQHIAAVSQGVLDDFRKIVPDTLSITAIHNPIDQQSIVLQAQQTSIIATYPALNQGYLVHVGKFKQQKNHQLLLQAYALTDRSLPLVLVGQGGLQADCETLAKRLGIEDKVWFMGFHPNPYPWIASATGMVLSSIYEGFGIVIAEALALGVPVISTDCQSGPAEILPSTNLVPVNDTDALAEKMTQLMHHPASFRHPFDEKLLPKAVAQRYLNLVS